MMAQSQTLVIDEQALAQLELELYIAQQASSTALEEGGNYAVQPTKKGFLPDADAQNVPILSQGSSQTEPNREPLKHLLIGTARTVTSTIHYLQVIGYADVGDWSPLMPSPNPGEVMSILSRSILVQ